MSLQEFSTSKTGLSIEQRRTLLQTWFAYVVAAVIGLVGGAMGVALTIGVMIIVAQTSAMVLEPTSYILIPVLVLVGVAVSWLLDRMLGYILPRCKSSLQQHLQVTFVFSVLIVLVEAFIFM